jgi:hypothetical protein
MPIEAVLGTNYNPRVAKKKCSDYFSDKAKRTHELISTLNWSSTSKKMRSA